MPDFIASIFSALIVFITVFGIIKVVHSGYTRKEINYRKYIVYVSSSVVVGGIITITIPFAYEKIFIWVLGA